MFFTRKLWPSWTGCFTKPKGIQAFSQVKQHDTQGWRTARTHESKAKRCDHAWSAPGMTRKSAKLGHGTPRAQWGDGAQEGGRNWIANGFLGIDDRSLTHACERQGTIEE